MIAVLNAVEVMMKLIMNIKFVIDVNMIIPNLNKIEIIKAMENLKTYLCKNCKYEGNPIDKEPCCTCTYYNIEAMSPVEFIYTHLQEIFDNYDCYDRRLKAYELLNLALCPSDGRKQASPESKCNNGELNTSYKTINYRAMDFEKIKNEIAQKDGFDTWKLMIECYCTTEPGRRVIDKNVNDLIRRVSACTPQ